MLWYSGRMEHTPVLPREESLPNVHAEAPAAGPATAYSRAVHHDKVLAFSRALRYDEFVRRSPRFARLLRTRYDDFEPLSRDRFVAGSLVPAAWYLRAQRVRAAYRDAAARVFRDFDVLVAAATPVEAQPIGTEWLELNGARLPARASMGVLTQPISCIGLPVVAAPVPLPGRLPIAVQLIAAPWREADAFRVAAALERAGVSFAPQPPAL